MTEAEVEALVAEQMKNLPDWWNEDVQTDEDTGEVAVVRGKNRQRATKSYTRWTPERMAKLAELWATDMHAEDIAKLLGTTVLGVRSAATNFKIGRRKPGPKRRGKDRLGERPKLAGAKKGNDGYLGR